MDEKSEPIVDSGSDSTTDPNTDTSPDGSKPEDTEARVSMKEHLAAKERYRKAEAKLQEIEAAQAKAEREAAEKRGEFEGLYNQATERATALEAELTTLREQVAAHQAAQRADLDKRREALGAMAAGLLAPGDYTSMALEEQQIRFLEATASAVDQAGKPKRSMAAGGGADPDALPEEVRRWAESHPLFRGRVGTNLVRNADVKLAWRRAHPDK